jgi:hypothetical protein
MSDPGDTVARLLTAAAALFGATGANRAPDARIPQDLEEKLLKGNSLGEKGRVVLLLRSVTGGKDWHERKLDTLETLDQIKALEQPLVPLDDDPRARRHLIEWGKAIRRSRPRRDSRGGIPPENPDTTGPSWFAWQEGDRIAIDVYAEWESLCIATILIERSGELLEDNGHERFFGAMIRSADQIARIIVMHYRRLWGRAQGIDFNRQVSEATLPKGKNRRHYELYPQVANSLDNLIRQIAGAFQTPVVGLFVPDFHGSIGVVGNVGYQSPPGRADLRAFRLPPTYQGITGAFCLSYEPGDGSGPEQIVTAQDMRKKRRELYLPVPELAPHESSHDYVTDAYLLPALQSDNDDSIRGPRYGPWVYVRVALSQDVWGDLAAASAPQGSSRNPNKKHVSAILKLQGRIPHELDRGRPPRFARFELRWLQECAGVLGLLFQRFVCGFEQKLVEGLGLSAAKALVRDLSSSHVSGESWQFKRYVNVLKSRYDAKCIVLAHRMSGAVVPIGLAHQDRRISDAVLKDLESLEMWEKREERGVVVVGDRTYNRYYLPLCDEEDIASDKVLAVVGVRHELDWFDNPDSEASRSDGFPRILERGIKLLTTTTHTAILTLAQHGKLRPVDEAVDEADDEDDGHEGHDDPGHADLSESLRAWTSIRADWNRLDAPFHDEFLDFLRRLTKTITLDNTAKYVVGTSKSTVGNYVRAMLGSFKGTTKRPTETNWGTLAGAKVRRPRADHEKLAGFRNELVRLGELCESRKP